MKLTSEQHVTTLRQIDHAFPVQKSLDGLIRVDSSHASKLNARPYHIMYDDGAHHKDCHQT
eukprot:scaffold369133_cov15-Prasinocladus_malaysianus.AAC.1